MHTCVYVCVCARARVRVRVRVRACVHACMRHASVCVYMHACVYVCVQVCAQNIASTLAMLRQHTHMPAGGRGGPGRWKWPTGRLVAAYQTTGGTRGARVCRAGLATRTRCPPCPVPSLCVRAYGVSGELGVRVVVEREEKERKRECGRMGESRGKQGAWTDTESSVTMRASVPAFRCSVAMQLRVLGGNTRNTAGKKENA